MFNIHRFEGLQLKPFIIVNSAIFFIILCAMAVQLYFIRNSIYEEMEKNAENTALVIQKRLGETYHETQEALHTFSSQIKEDLSLAQILKELSLFEVFNNVLSWTSLDWIGPDGRAYGNSKIGIFKEPILFEKKRTYVDETKKKPGELILSEPTYGIPSSEWIIPGGFGVQNEKGVFLGTLSFGFNIHNLIKKLWNSDDFLVNVLVVSKDGVIILDFANGKKSGAINPPLRKLLKHVGRKDLPNTVDYGGYRYTHASKVSLDKQYFILSGFNINTYHNKYNSRVFSVGVFFLVATIIFHFIIYLYRKNFFELLRTVKTKSIRYYNDINENIENFTKKTCDELDHIIDDVSNGRNTRQTVSRLKKIRSYLPDLVLYSSCQQDFVDVDRLLTECISLKNRDFFLKNFKVKKEVKVRTPIYLNEQLLKLSVLSIFSLIIKTNPNSSHITIAADVQTDGYESSFVLKVADKGFGFSETDLDIFLASSDRQVDDTIPIEEIKKLLEFQGGKLSILGEWNVGTTYTFTLPIKEVTMEELLVRRDTSNIVNLLNFKENSNKKKQNN